MNAEPRLITAKKHWHQKPSWIGRTFVVRSGVSLAYSGNFVQVGRGIRNRSWYNGSENRRRSFKA